MPFAKKFRAMMGFPFAGDTIGDFTVESVEVRDEKIDAQGHGYSARMVLQGPGGQQGLRGALKPLLSSHPTTFSAYGTPYQLWFGKPEIESLGGKRYAVTVAGVGVHVLLEEELDRLLRHLNEERLLAPGSDFADPEALLESYLERYRAEIRRKVDRYRRRLRQAQKPDS